MKLKNILFFGLLITFFTSCSDDDNETTPTSVPPRLLSEVSVENDVELQEYLSTHFYNYEDFMNTPEGFDFKIVIDTIAGDNSGKTPLIDQVETSTIKISSNQLGLSVEETDIEHTLYTLVAREGVGTFPTVADSIVARFEGSLLNGSVFDGAVNTPLLFDLPGSLSNPGTFRGFAEGVTVLKSGGAVVDNGDGTFEVEGFGIGAIFMPSGLALFNNFSSSIPAFSPLIFKVDLFTVIENTDHDNDGIPSIREDLNNNNFLLDDNSDNTGVANYLDSDDDDDGIPTREEITIAADGTVTFPDSDNDGTPDYLDNDN